MTMRAASAALAAALMLTGCAADLPPMLGGGMFARPAGPCPAIDFGPSTDRIAKFRILDRPDPQTLEFTATLSNVRLQCLSVSEDEVRARAFFDYRVELGPAIQGDALRAVTLRYFVAYLRDDGAVQDKELRESAPIVFEGAQRTATGTETAADIVLPLQSARGPLDYEIVVGLQLTPAQLRYNRGQTAPRP